ncbi:MAG: polyprenyl synthetase family protein [bacterium]
MNKPNFNKLIDKTYPDFIQSIYTELEELISGEDDLGPLYGMGRYHIGFVDQSFKKLDKPKTGKIFRPILCLLTTKALSGKVTDAIPPAVAIETFHNFSLIHDDIEDNDEKRRGKPCVWKIWDLDHGVNSGDALFNLSYRALIKIQDPKLFMTVFEKLSYTYGLIVEGQYLDIEMAKRDLTDSWLNLDLYLKMIRRKSAELIAVSCEIGALTAKADTKTQKAMYEFGINLGLSYQAYDDYAGVWKNEKDTGKKSMKDIIQKKKALPLMHALSSDDKEIREKLARYYSDKIDYKKALEIAQIFEKAGSKEFCKQLSLEYRNKAIKIIKANIPDKICQKQYINLVRSLIQLEG